ncbi:MAG: helix-turn-helix domain-containing protein, partial [Fimbriimonadaceae bacterium]
MAVTKLELARRLKKARESANLTQEEAAKRIEVSRVTLTQIEGGQRNVSSLELARLAKLYQRSLSSLLEESGSEEEPLEALLRASPELKESPQAFEELRRVIQLAGEVDKLERAISPSPGCIATYSFAEPASFQEAISQGEHAARQERQRLGLGHLPIADVAELIRSQGILARSVELPESISGVCIFLNSGQTVVVVNSRQHKNRRRFSYAHEYAHAVIDRSPGSALVSGESGEGRLIERRANAFAVEFLMPSEAVRESLDRLSRNSSVAEVSYSYDSET